MKREQKDYINYNYTGIKDRKKMSMDSRASQFSPFDALTGFGSIISQSGIVSDEIITLSDDQKQQINSVLVSLKKGDRIRIIYYDLTSYDDREGVFSGFDQQKRQISLEGRKIDLNDVIMLRRVSE